MIGRTVELLFLVALGGVWGWTQDAAAWTYAGCLIGALAWMVGEEGRGVPMILISHNLRQVFDLVDRIVAAMEHEASGRRASESEADVAGRLPLAP